jgi:Na+/H+ antiporter NhaC
MQISILQLEHKNCESMPKRVIIIRTICKERHIIMAAVVTEKIIEMFLILLGGVIVYKAGLIDDKTVPKLSNLLLMFISPLLIFQSYQMEFEMRFTDCFGH